MTAIDELVRDLIPWIIVFIFIVVAINVLGLLFPPDCFSHKQQAPWIILAGVFVLLFYVVEKTNNLHRINDKRVKGNGT
jgi:hypothetical protein